ncbi:MAG: hypothetical protein ACSLFI_09335 [Solirubrobacterales bacterium]
MNMDSVDSAFEAYIEAFKAGDVDPNPFFERVDASERPQLEFLIDAFLEEAPVPEFSELAFESSGARELANSLIAGIGGRSGQWPVLLPRLRNEAKLSREEVMSGLATALGAEGEEVEKVGDYYHDMEWGSLPAKGVTGQVLEALAKIYRTSAETLREAGQQLGPESPRQSGLIFARQPSDVVYQEISDADRGPVSRESDPPDRIDQLFTAGE